MNNKHIKASFRAGPGERVGGESMWVKIIEENADGNTVIGELDNEPMLEGHGCKLGDRVICTKVFFDDMEYYVFAEKDWRFAEEEKRKELQKTTKEAKEFMAKLADKYDG